ncbi:hypothetical protein ACKVWH_000193 [Pyricularia oryzae]
MTFTARFEVAGECHVHGSMEVQGLLGPLAIPWVLCTNAKKEAYRIYPWFANWVSSQKCEDDPQPGPVPEEWWKIEWNRVSDDPACFIQFENTGEVINSDPRLDSARCQLGDAGTGGKAGVWVVQSTIDYLQRVAGYPADSEIATPTAGANPAS